MSTIKSLSVDKGDLFYIDHNSDNFTIIDCNLINDREQEILNELESIARTKGIHRFISTHPDEDHIHGIEHIDDAGLCTNFYCVQNAVNKDLETTSFKRYKQLRDDEGKAYYIYQGCSRKWMNLSDSERDCAGICVLWPDTDNDAFKQKLAEAEQYGKPNNICPIIRYALENGVVAMWMGDLESDFMEQIVDLVDLPEADIVFAPHHGRKSGHIPKKWLDRMNPKVIVVGEAPSEDLTYYNGYNTITQNSAGDIEFECEAGKVHVRVSSSSYTTGYLEHMGISDRTALSGKRMRYIGSFKTHEQP